MSDKLEDLANGIYKYLQKFEADPNINIRRNDNKYRLKPYFNVSAWQAGRYVAVQYVSFQGHTNLTKQEAREYLDWLHEGNVGTHRSALAKAVPHA